MNTDRNLLFAVLALQADLLDRERFVQACTLWAARKATSIAELLAEQGWLTPAGKAVVDQLIEFKLNKHGGDVQASLAEAAGDDVRGALASVADIDVERSLAALAALPPHTDGLDGPAEVSAGPPADGAGRNLLYEEIGCGGMGRVLRGRDPDLGRDLAVKVLREDRRAEPGMERRFVEEAQIGGQLHPGIVPVYELGRFPDRRPYFTMKLVKGRTLAELLKERPDPGHDRTRLLTTFEQVCQTMAYAHSKGVIHRDLKPSNIMLGAFGEVQVMDWGLAKVLGHGDGDPEATAAGTVIRTARSGSTTEEDERTGMVGTPAYMAPEQARGQTESVNERADVFGLGGLLCVILTGQPPYAGPDRAELLRQAVAGELTDTFGRLDGCGADADLVALCKACLAPRPEDRPRAAGEVAARMAVHQAAVQERLRQAELERAAAQARAEEAKATAAAEHKAQRRTRALAAAVLTVVAVGAGGGLLIQHQAARHQADQARRDSEQQQMVESALEKAQALREQARWGEAAALLEQVRRVAGDAGPDNLRQKLDLAEAELALVNRLESIRQRRATIVDGKFDTRTAEHDYAAAFREAGLGEVQQDDETAVAARVRASGVSGTLVAALDDWASIAANREAKSWLLGVARRADPDPWGDRFRDQAVWQDRQALQALAEDALRDGAAKLGELSPQVLASFGALLGDAPEAVRLLHAAQRRYPNDFWLNIHLGNALLRVGQAAEAVGYNRVAVALRPDASAAHNNLGAALLNSRDVDGAIAAFRKAIDLDSRHVKPHANLGYALCEKGELDEAITASRKAIGIAPKYARAHEVFGWALLNKGDLDGAIAACRKAIDLDPKNPSVHATLGAALYGKGDLDGAIVKYGEAIKMAPMYARAHAGLGGALRGKGDLDRAVAECRKAAEMAPKDSFVHIELGYALRAKGDLDGAIAAFRAADDVDPKLAYRHNELGLALHRKKDLEGAVAEFRKAIDLKPKWADAHLGLGHALRDKGDLDGAIAACRKAIDLDPKLVGAHIGLGWALRAKGNLDGAIAEFRKATNVDPKLAYAHHDLALALHAKKDVEGAVAEFRKALDLNPKWADVHISIGHALREKGDLDGAIRRIPQGHRP
jgi:tetratricopeptide (TPR) repeat protein/tRNA A-37 threonylcarbamoyl transferase component Bud32